MSIYVISTYHYPGFSANINLSILFVLMFKRLSPFGIDTVGKAYYLSKLNQNNIGVHHYYFGYFIYGVYAPIVTETYYLKVSILE